MTAHTLERDGAVLCGTDTGGAGAAVVFQHGLGGDEAQVAEVFPADTAARRLTLECRGQGRSALGPADKLSIANFAADVLAFATARGARRFVAGGISMGAAIALRLAIITPSCVRALILSRPAWLWGSGPANMLPFAEVADLLTAHPNNPAAALAAFDATPTAHRLAREAPDNLASLRGFFTRPSPHGTAALLGAIAKDGLGVTEAQVRALRLPALVIGNAQDAVHPLDYARALGSAIPGARFVAVTAKATDRSQHAAEVRAAIAAFIATLPADGETT